MMKVCDDFDMCDHDENSNHNRFIVSDGSDYYDLETGTSINQTNKLIYQTIY